MEDKTRSNEDFEQNQLFEENPLISDKKNKENKKNNKPPIVKNLLAVVTAHREFAPTITHKAELLTIVLI